MALEAVMERFKAERFKASSPLTIMARLLMQQALSLMAVVALGFKKSMHEAAQASPEVRVSLMALYEKVNRTEPEVVRALVEGVRTGRGRPPACRNCTSAAGARADLTECRQWRPQGESGCPLTARGLS